MKTGIATVSIAGELPEKLDAIAAAGFDGIEIFEQDFIAFDGTPSEVGAMVRDRGLDIMLFQPFRDFEGLPEPERTRAFDRAERKFDVMEQLGTDLVLICSSVHPQSLGGIDRAADDLRELGERAAKRGLRVGYEALAWGKYVNDHRDAWEIVRRADHPNIGIIVDSFHTLGRKLSPESIRTIPGDKIFFVQLADAPLIEMDLLYWSRHFRNMPGEGDLDVTAFMNAVVATGYDGPISLEIFNDQFRGGSPRKIAQDGQRSLLALMDDVAQNDATHAPKGHQLPKRSTVRGVAFVEFAADEDEADRLGALLASMGFRAARQHINKAVTVWEQGHIRIVINVEREGFARATYQSRGTCVCDIGLVVEDAASTVARAKSLNIPIFSQPIRQGELNVPAIRAVGDGVMHFIDERSGLADVWEVEFDSLNSEDAQDAGLTTVDHIAQSMNYEEMLTWALFYTCLFDVRKTPVVDVVDPGGIVRSQVIETPDAGLRLTLNGAETDRTLAGRFVSGRPGSTVQHIAFQTEDIIETIDRMAALGFDPLEIPPNYYDDAQARFGLTSDERARLEARNILVDEENGARFYQAYSKPYGEGFFFEIVRRDEGYAGYGAPNAPYRTAALKRVLNRRQEQAL